VICTKPSTTSGKSPSRSFRIPDYLYFGERHTLAYTVLEYGVVHGAGFTVITGAVGCGKTTLIRHLLNRIDQDVTVGLISNTRQDIGELLKWVLLAFDQPL
jgi:general secretion pathway protein A